jgi:predicted small secreted protein
MIRLRTLLPVLLAVCATTLAGCASTRTTGPDEWDGLVRQPGTRLGAVFVRPDAEIVGYRSVKIDPVEVSFARNWDPNRGGRSQLGRLNADDMAAIQTGVADLFRETFRAELERGGFQLVDVAGPDTLRVTAAIVDLYISAPDTMSAGRSRTYTANAGRMTLVAELRDSLTGELLARAVDARSARSTGTWNITNRVTNTADARRAMGIWATALRQGMEEMYGRAKAE